jgi:uncharacterized membrane protein
MPTETPTTSAPAEQQPAVRDELEKAVAGHRTKGTASSDRPLVIAGALLMAVGVVGAFVQYNVTLSQDDARDIASTQVLVLALLGLVLVGAALFVTGALSRVLRLWLLRQLLENQAREERAAAPLDVTAARELP